MNLTCAALDSVRDLEILKVLVDLKIHPNRKAARDRYVKIVPVDIRQELSHGVVEIDEDHVPWRYSARCTAFQRCLGDLIDTLLDVEKDQHQFMLRDSLPVSVIVLISHRMLEWNISDESLTSSEIRIADGYVDRVRALRRYTKTAAWKKWQMNSAHTTKQLKVFEDRHNQPEMLEFGGQSRPYAGWKP